MKSEYLTLKSEGFSDRFLRTSAGSPTSIRKEILKYPHIWRDCPNCKKNWVKVSELPKFIPDKNGNDIRRESGAHKSGFCSYECKEEYKRNAENDYEGIDIYGFLSKAGFSKRFLDCYPGDHKAFRVHFVRSQGKWQICRNCKDKYMDVRRIKDPVYVNCDPLSGNNTVSYEPYDVRLFAVKDHHKAGICSLECAKEFYGCEGEELKIRISGFLLASSPDFYKSDEWRKLRYKALKKHGARCQCCGKTPNHGAILHVDHVKPRKLYPDLALDLSNLQVLCEDCNLGKGAWDSTDWREGDVSNA